MIKASAEGTVTVWTAEAERLLRYSQDDVTGRAFPSLAQDAPMLEHALNRARLGESVHTICLTTRLTTKDGREAPTFVCVDALRDREGRVSEFQIFLRDLRTVVFEPAFQDVSGQRSVPDQAATDRLTPRQRLVLELIARGHSTREIASRLHRSVKTIETHRAQLMKRLNIFHVPGLVRFAIRAGLATLD
jgi:PAS domain S-box-containing protein